MAIITTIARSAINGSLRMEAEYYTPAYVETDQSLRALNSLPLGPYCRFIKKGIFDLPPSNYTETGIPLIRTTEIKTIIADLSSVARIPISVHRAHSSTELNSKDIVFTKIGANIGDVSILPACEAIYNFSQNVAGAKIRRDKIDPHYLACFFSTRHGKAQVRRIQMLSGQGKLELADIRRLLVPPGSRKLQARISAVYQSAESHLEQARRIYTSAEHQLLELIGLGNWHPIHSTTFIKSSHSLTCAHRADAEYFQPKFEAAFERLNSDVSLVQLGRLARLIKGIEVGSSAYQDQGFPFWRVSDLTRFGLQDRPGNYIREDVYLRLRDQWQAKPGELLLSKDATPGIAFYLTTPVIGIVSSGILRLSLLADIPGCYLELVLNSRFAQLQIERDSAGSVIKHWRPSDVRKTLIPRVDQEQQLADFVAESHRERAHAKRLLDDARSAVEILIERNENDALSKLDQVRLTNDLTLQ